MVLFTSPALSDESSTFDKTLSQSNTVFKILTLFSTLGFMVLTALTKRMLKDKR